MCRFVRCNVLHILLVHIERKIDLRLDYAKHKGRNNIFALIDIITQKNGCADIFFHS